MVEIGAEANVASLIQAADRSSDKTSISSIRPTERAVIRS
jgi:hypothetical protein